MLLFNLGDLIHEDPKLPNTGSIVLHFPQYVQPRLDAVIDAYLASSNFYAGRRDLYSSVERLKLLSAVQNQNLTISYYSQLSMTSSFDTLAIDAFHVFLLPSPEDLAMITSSFSSITDVRSYRVHVIIRNLIQRAADYCSVAMDEPFEPWVIRELALSITSRLISSKSLSAHALGFGHNQRSFRREFAEVFAKLKSDKTDASSRTEFRTAFHSLFNRCAMVNVFPYLSNLETNFGLNRPRVEDVNLEL